jgi:hypothetical protein
MKYEIEFNGNWKKYLIYPNMNEILEEVIKERLETKLSC